MSEFYENYNEGPQNRQNMGDSGTAPLVLGLLSLIFALSFSRLVAIVLGIIAIVMGGKTKDVCTEAKAGFVMGIIGLVLSLCIYALFFLVLLPSFMLMVF